MKNVLVIVYYFPPMGGSGVQRPLKFVKYLREFGWNPIILCPEPGAYHVFDESLQEELDSLNVEVHRVKGKTLLHKSGDRLVKLPSFLDNFLRKISQFFWLPDNKKAWIEPGLQKAREVMQNQKIDLVFATAPPYSNLILAKRIKEEVDIPVVMDLRDDWLESHLIKYSTPFHYSKMKKIELETLIKADKIITINNYIADAIDQRKVNTEKAEVITHGFDFDDFRTAKIDNTSNKIRFLYSGTFYPESGPENFIEAIALFIEENPSYKNKIELQFQGNSTKEYTRHFKKYNLQDNVKDFGFLPHSEAVTNLIKADILWLNNSHKKNPFYLSLGKTYEYMAAKKPIIAMIPDGDVKNTLIEYGTAYISEPNDLISLKNNIGSVIELIRDEKLPFPNQTFIDKFNRKRLTERLAEIFNVISAQ